MDATGKTHRPPWREPVEELLKRKRRPSARHFFLRLAFFLAVFLPAFFAALRFLAMDITSFPE